MSFEYRIIQIRLHRLVKFFYVLIVVLHTFSHLCIVNGAAEQDHNSNGAFELISEASQTPDIVLNLEEAVSSDENNNKQNLTELVEVVFPSLLRESDHDLRILDTSVIDDSDVVSSKQTSENIQLPDTPAISDIKDGEIDEIDIETKLIIEQQDLFEQSIGPSVVGDFDIGNHLDNPFLDDLESASSSNYDHVTFDDTSADVPTSYEEAEGEHRTNTHHMTADPDSHANQSAMTVPGEIQSKIEIEIILDEINPIDDANSQDVGAILIDITGSSSTSASSELDVPEGTSDRTRPDINDTKDENDSDNDSEINVGSEDSSGTSGNSGSDSSSGSSSSGSSSGSGSSGSGSSSGGSSSSSSGSGCSTDTVLSRSLDSRIRRLAALVADRRDLIDSYNTQQMEEETIMNSLNRHIMAALQHRPLVPLSDSTCTWSYLRERCEPPCECEWSYRFGDIHPGRACRRVTAFTPGTEPVHKQQDNNAEFEVLDPSTTHGVSELSDPPTEPRVHIPDYSASISAYPRLPAGDDNVYMKATELGFCDPSVWTPGPIRVAVRKIIFSVKAIIDFFSDKVFQIRFGRL